MKDSQHCPSPRQSTGLGDCREISYHLLGLASSTAWDKARGASLAEEPRFRVSLFLDA